MPCAKAKRFVQSARAAVSVYTTCSGLRDHSSSVRAETQTVQGVSCQRWRQQRRASAAPFAAFRTGVAGSTDAQPSWKCLPARVARQRRAR